MKIEMGESLFYSWLRHVKECQIVQTNWKASPSWQLNSQDEIERFWRISDSYIQSQYGYEIFKNNSLSQLLLQAEVDVLGISVSPASLDFYAIDVAFHESGLNYGDRAETVSRVLKKLIRTALGLIGYFGTTKGELIFASPKINNAILVDLAPCIKDLNRMFQEHDYQFNARIIANDDFNTLILKPILIASDGVSDTSELFLRSYQLTNMFKTGKTEVPKRQRAQAIDAYPDDLLSELKVGRIVQTLLRSILESNKLDIDEINQLRQKNYSKSQFGIDFPLLVLADEPYDSARYYSKPIYIRDVEYRLCSQWFETTNNNDRPLLLAWLAKHESIE